jgi:hypothetical protein
MTPSEREGLEQFLNAVADEYEDDRDDIDIELASVVRMLRSDSSKAFLCGEHDKSRWLDELVRRLEWHEHRD